MKAVAKFAIPALLIGACVVILWPRVDQTASQVAMSITGLGLILAWYSILDLRQKRGEGLWHTADRMLRATFSAITLVFVVNLVFQPTGTLPPPPGVERYFCDQVQALAKDPASWDVIKLQQVVDAHFSNLGRDNTIYLSVDPNHKFSLTSRGGKVIAAIQ